MPVVSASSAATDGGQRRQIGRGFGSGGSGPGLGRGVGGDGSGPGGGPGGRGSGAGGPGGPGGPGARVPAAGVGAVVGCSVIAWQTPTRRGRGPRRRVRRRWPAGTSPTCGSSSSP